MAGPFGSRRGRSWRARRHRTTHHSLCRVDRCPAEWDLARKLLAKVAADPRGKAVHKGCRELLEVIPTPEPKPKPADPTPSED